MSALRDLQDDIAGHIRTGTAPARLILAIRPSGLTPAARLAVYRNHFLITLTECLSVTYPVLKALVGERFFDQCARAYAATHPPRSPVLSDYGETFPRFVADHAGSEFDYLADVGAFEWAVNHAYHADDAPPLDAGALARIPAGRSGDIVLAFQPSARLVVSAFPVLDIWRAHQPSAGDQAINLADGGVRLIVWRSGLDVVWQRLTEGAFAFTGALLDGACLTDACAAALATETSFDAGVALRDLFAGGLVTALATPS